MTAARGEAVSHEHSSSGADLSRSHRRRVRLILALCVVPALLATVVVLWALWPQGTSEIGARPHLAPGVTMHTGIVVRPPHSTDGGLEVITVRLEDAEATRSPVAVDAPAQQLAGEIESGDPVRLMHIPNAEQGASPYVFVGFVRTVPMAWLALLYLGTVAAVARLRGLFAVVGLFASLSVVGFFILPAIVAGSSPVLVALVGSSAMLFLAVYLAHGISIRTTTALLGTIVGLAITIGLALWGVDATRLTGTGEDGQRLLGMFGDIALQELLLCGIVIAGLGALNDVTITQASAVWELQAANPYASRRHLFARGMRIGRDHIASTVYTLSFAYVGTALPVLIAASLISRPVLDTLMIGQIAEEIVRTLVSSIGLILAIPVTTAIAALLAKTGDGAAPRSTATVVPAAHSELS